MLVAYSSAAWRFAGLAVLLTPHFCVVECANVLRHKLMLGQGKSKLKTEAAKRAPGGVFDTDEASTLLTKTYEDLNPGFNIPAQEQKALEAVGGSPIYGEILPESLAKVLEYVKPTRDDVFYDLGSGIGKTVLQTALTTPVKKAVGIEFEATRHKTALQARKAVLGTPAAADRVIEFEQKDFAKATLDDATIAYSCATCFSTELLGKICDLLPQKKVRMFVVLKDLGDVENCTRKFWKAHVMQLPMSWSRKSGGSSIYFYQPHA
ncbi:unnamed protein product [Amoebophrya sp. A120]|nr:unnamed protein product [Amoebophrya sp. A120]|eukprot:GSA120T00002327001.1